MLGVRGLAILGTLGWESPLWQWGEWAVTKHHPCHPLPLLPSLFCASGDVWRQCLQIHSVEQRDQDLRGEGKGREKEGI